MAPRRRRPPITRERVIEAAMELADAEGLEALSMRRLARSLEVEAMSLYHHVPDKDAILDAMVDVVFSEVEVPKDLDWQAAIRHRCECLRAALRRHPWALPVLESRLHPGPANLRQHEAVLATLRGAGFDLALTAHAISLLDAYVFGFAFQEMSLPFDTGEEARGVVEQVIPPEMALAFPHLAELATQHVTRPGYAHADEFTFGLDLLLEGLQRRR